MLWTQERKKKGLRAVPIEPCKVHMKKNLGLPCRSASSIRARRRDYASRFHLFLSSLKTESQEKPEVSRRQKSEDQCRLRHLDDRQRFAEALVSSNPVLVLNFYVSPRIS